jgi:hypothetical protein
MKSIEKDAADQIKELDKVTESLNNLLIFVSKQKERVIQQEQAIKQLTAEKEKLEPIVKAQRDVIERLFELQEKRSNRQRWVEIVIAFIVGTLSSTLASFISRLIRHLIYFIKRKQTRI